MKYMHLLKKKACSKFHHWRKYEVPVSIKYKQIRRDRTVTSQCNFTLLTKRKQSILHANRVKHFLSGIRRAKTFFSG